MLQQLLVEAVEVTPTTVGNEPLGWWVLALKGLGLGAQNLVWPRSTSLPCEKRGGEEQSGEVEDLG